MKYMISQLNREVELNDELVSEYLKHDDLREYEFVMAAINEVGHLPNKDEISDERLSLLCMETLLNNLHVFQELPIILQTIEKNVEDFRKASTIGTLLEISIQSEEA